MQDGRNEMVRACPVLTAMVGGSCFPGDGAVTFDCATEVVAVENVNMMVVVVVADARFLTARPDNGMRIQSEWIGSTQRRKWPKMKAVRAE